MVNRFELILKSIEREKKIISDELSCDILSADEAAQQIAEMNKKERNIIKKMVAEVHVTCTGEPRAINYDAHKQLFSTRVAGKIRITAKTEDMLYDKLMQHYGLVLKTYTVSDCFNAAVKLKQETLSRSSETIRSDISSFHRFITPEFQKMAVVDVNGKFLQKYTLDTVSRLSLKVAAFNKYKGILNLIFKYAVLEQIIETNPVESIINTNYYDRCEVSDYRPENKILSVAEIETLKDAINTQMKKSMYKGYHFNGYAGLLAIETGMRAGELMALKWSDISDGKIWIHSQQLCERRDGKKVFFLVNWTKNEKRARKRKSIGRYFPITDAIQTILDDIHEAQQSLNIETEYVLCRSDGTWNNTVSYEKWLRKITTRLGFNVTNNHALRMSLNSNVFIPLGIPVTDRAQMLGHSVQTNENYYSYASKDNIDSLRDTLNGNMAQKEAEVAPYSPLEPLIFEVKKIRESL